MADLLFLDDADDGHVDAGERGTQIRGLLPAQHSSRPPHGKDYGAAILPKR